MDDGTAATPGVGVDDGTVVARHEVRVAEGHLGVAGHVPEGVEAVHDARVERDDLSRVDGAADEEAVAAVRAGAAGRDAARESEGADGGVGEDGRSPRGGCGGGGDDGVAHGRARAVDLVGEVGAHLRLELVETQVLALLHHRVHQRRAVPLAPVEGREHVQAMEVSLLLQAPRAAKVVARASRVKLLHQTGEHRRWRVGDASRVARADGESDVKRSPARAPRALRKSPKRRIV